VPPETDHRRTNGKGRDAAPSEQDPARDRAQEKALRLLDFLEHLEDALGRTDEKALIGLAEAATLEGITAGSGSFGHGHHLLLLRFALSGFRINKKNHSTSNGRSA
jgi:hypothetical protein